MLQEMLFAIVPVGGSGHQLGSTYAGWNVVSAECGFLLSAWLVLLQLLVFPPPLKCVPWSPPAGELPSQCRHGSRLVEELVLRWRRQHTVDHAILRL